MSFLDQFAIKTTNTPSTYGNLAHESIEIPQGKDKSRLKFSSPLLPYSDLHIYVETIKKNHFDRVKDFFLSLLKSKFIKCIYNNRTIYININSLSKRLGVTKEEIISASKEGSNQIHSLIENHYKQYIQNEMIIDRLFQKIINEKYKDDGDTLKTLDNQSVNKIDFRKCIGITVNARIERLNISQRIFSLKDGRILHLKKQKGTNEPLITLFSKNVLGKGASAKVYEVFELSQGKFSIAKIAKDKSDKDTLKNEYKLLNSFSDTPNGIQDKPTSFFEFEVNRKKFCGYIAPKYDGNLKKQISSLTKKEKIECCRQILQGLVELQKKQICHGDLKEANCLIKRNPSSLICAIADFGGATIGNWPHIATLNYYCDGDIKAYIDLIHNVRMETKDTQSKNITDLSMSRDIYAAGHVFSHLLDRKDKKVNEFIKKMKNEFWIKRPLAIQSLQEFEQIFPIVD